MNTSSQTYNEYNLGVARYWAAHGFNVFPVKGSGEECKQPIPGLRWGSEATNDPDTLKRWWLGESSGSYPSMGVAVSLRQSNYIVIDCDVKHNVNGLSAFLTLLQAHDEDIHNIFQSYTPSGGRHFFFRIPEGIRVPCSPGRLPKGIDVKGDGGYVIARGSKSVDGKEYHNGDASTLDVNETAYAPQWLLDLILKPTDERSVKEGVVARHTPQYARTALKMAVRAILDAQLGERNTILCTEAFNMGTLLPGSDLSYGEVESQLYNAGIRIGLSEREVYSTVTRAMRNGIDRPRTSNVDDSEGLTEAEQMRERAPASFFQVEELEIDSPLFNRIKKNVLDCAVHRHEEMALGSTFALLSTVMGRQVYTPTSSSICLFSLIVAPTGYGKNSYLAYPIQFLRLMNMLKMVGETNLSSAVHLQKIFDTKKVTLNILDEFEIFLEKLTREGAETMEQEIARELKILWSIEAYGQYITKGSATRDSVVHECPFFNILGATTPTSLFESVTKRSLSDGFVNRFLFFPTSETHRPKRIRTGNAMYPSRCLVRSVEELNDLGCNIKELGLDEHEKFGHDLNYPVIIQWGSKEAEELFGNFYAEIGSLREEDRELFVRLPDQALRMATIIAASRDGEEAEVSVRDMMAGITIAKKSGNYLYKGRMLFVAENKNEQYTRRVMRIIQEAGSEGISKTLLVRRTQFLSQRDRNSKVDDLIEAGLVIKETVPANRGKSITIYRMHPQAYGDSLVNAQL